MFQSLVGERREMRRDDARMAMRRRIEAEVDELRGSPRSESGRRAVMSSAYEKPNYYDGTVGPVAWQPGMPCDPYNEPPPPPWADHGEVKYWMKFGHAPRAAPFNGSNTWEVAAAADHLQASMEYQIAREVEAASPRRQQAPEPEPIMNAGPHMMNAYLRRAPFTEVGGAGPHTLEAGMGDSGMYHVRRPGRASLLY